MQKNTITVKKDVENPEATEIIAKSIIDLANAVEKFNKGPLKERAIIILLQDITGMSIVNIKKVLAAIPQLKKEFVK